MPDYRTSRPSPARKLSPERKQELVDRVLDFYQQDKTAKGTERELRLQRYAKLRGWTEGKNWPWQDASDVSLGDIMTANLRVQDTLHNAVMSGTPVVAAKALNAQDAPREGNIDALLDYQIFVEDAGEKTLTTLAQQFVEDGECNAEVSWVKETRRAIEIRRYPELPPDALPGRMFQQEVNRLPGMAQMRVRDGSEGWDWDVRFQDGTAASIAFYAEPGQPTEMRIDRQVSMFDGPKLDTIAWDDIFYPVRCDNLNIPGPSNKGGAGHVIVRRFPLLDEIDRLVKSGFYDQVEPDDLDAIRNGAPPSKGEEEVKEQRDVMAGRDNPATPPAGAEAHGTRTVLRCFDIFDYDRDGQTEDIVCWVVLESRTLLRCNLLSEHWPYMPPRRPFVHEVFLPIEGSASGISLPELMEGYHDLSKMLMDQTVDSNTLTGVPFFFYRAAGGNRPETLRIGPGEGIPVADPQRDVNFPKLQNNGVAVGLNLMTMVNAMQEKLTNIGDLQLGRVPIGRASALRTVGGMSMVAQQGEARPERILRRFFMALADAWSMAHQLNKVYLTKAKQVRLRAVKSKAEEPYVEVQGADVRAQMIFDFKANAYNASKASLQDALNAVAGMYINPVALQAGIVQPDGIYRFMRDYGAAYGVDGDQYLAPPSPEATKQRLLAEEVIYAIYTNQGAPDCAALEPGGAQEHYAKLMSFTQSQQFGLYNEAQVEQLKAYMSRLLEMVRAQAAQQRMAQAMEAFQAGRANPGAA
ncbi:MAG: hypothetical protein WA210_09120, partial [Burkholderiaceae bacterium]